MSKLFGILFGGILGAVGLFYLLALVTAWLQEKTDMRKTLGEIISVLLVLALVFGAGYFVGTQKQKGDTIVVDPDDDKLDLKLPGETEKRVVTVEEIKTKLVEMDELSTYSGEYIVTYGKDETRHFFDDIAIPLTTNSIVINCEGIVKAMSFS